VKVGSGSFGYSWPGVSVSDGGAAAVGFTGRDRGLVTDQPAAAVGEDGKMAGKACAEVLVDSAGKAPDARAFRGDIATDRDVAASGKLTSDHNVSKSNR
jgi:hypothetical protein